MVNRITIILAALSLILGLGLVFAPQDSPAQAHMAGCWVNAKRPAKLAGIPAGIAKAGWSCDYVGGSHNYYFASTIRLQYWSSYNGGRWMTLGVKRVNADSHQGNNYVTAPLANGCKQYRTVQDFYQITPHGSNHKVSTARTIYALCR